jgi:hypothetical protein
VELIINAKDILEKVDLKDRHSFFQLNNFIIGKEPTLQAKLWQCAREINARVESYDSLKEEIENTFENFEILEIKIFKGKKITEKQSCPYKKRILEIKIKKLERNFSKKDSIIKKLNKKLSMVEEELNFFIRTFSEIEKVEKIKKFDDVHVQNEYWSAKLGADLNLRFLLNLPTDLELCKTILALPDSCNVKAQLLHALKEVQNNISNNNNKEVNKLEQQQ